MAAFATPTRDQIARIAQNDPQIIRALELLFDSAAQLLPDDIASLNAAIQGNEISLGVAMGAANTALSNRAFDYIDLDTNAPHDHRAGRVSWHSTEQTAEIGMEYGVTQQVGLEVYARVENATGVTIQNGTVVGFSGVGPNNVLSVAPYLANGASPSLYVLGIMTHDLPDAGSVGYCTTWGRVGDIDTTGAASGETWAVGNILYANPSIAGALTNVKPTAPDNVIPMAAVLAVNATSGEIFVRPTISQMQYYAVIEKNTDQSPAATNTEYPITFDAVQIGNGVVIGTPTSRIVVPVSGLYRLDANVQLSSSSSIKKNVYVWFKKNGAAIANSTRIVTTDLSNGYIPMTLSETVSLDAGDYIELAFASDSTAVRVDSVAATTFAPGAPSVILSVTQVQQ